MTTCLAHTLLLNVFPALEGTHFYNLFEGNTNGVELFEEGILSPIVTNYPDTNIFLAGDLIVERAHSQTLLQITMLNLFVRITLIISKMILIWVEILKIRPKVRLV